MSSTLNVSPPNHPFSRIGPDHFCPRIEDVRALVEEYRPDVLVHDDLTQTNYMRTNISKFTTSMWTEEQSREVEETARKIIPNIKFHAIPYGLQVAKGPEAIVEYLTQKVPMLLES
jgi:hypothetical protein